MGELPQIHGMMGDAGFVGGLDGDLSAASRLVSSCRAAHPPPSDEGFMCNTA